MKEEEVITFLQELLQIEIERKRKINGVFQKLR